MEAPIDDCSGGPRRVTGCTGRPAPLGPASPDARSATGWNRGRADRIGYDLFRIAGAPVTQDQRTLAAAWRSGVVSHRTAAGLDLIGRSIHAARLGWNLARTCSTTSCRTEDVDVETMELRGVPVTTPPGRHSSTWACR